MVIRSAIENDMNSVGFDLSKPKLIVFDSLDETSDYESEVYDRDLGGMIVGTIEWAKLNDDTAQYINCVSWKPHTSDASFMKQPTAGRLKTIFK
jgi:hypothetical protein